MKKIQAVRGMNDIVPEQMAAWQAIESALRTTTERYGYREIRFPIIESTHLFKRSIGEVTDIVEKEMYTFVDRNGDSLSLRPEGTAGCVRAGIEHGLLYNQVQRLWYLGPMFRHERPQKGRYRQFQQFGLEAFGLSGPDIEAEILVLTARLWKMLGLNHCLRLEINSLGTLEERARYRTALQAYFQGQVHRLDADSLRRLGTNPLRILDSKNPELSELIHDAPLLTDYLDNASKEHMQILQDYLEATGIAYKINPRLVRGLDYYSHTVFEWVTDNLGAQNAVCSGGRYDALVAQLGGKPTSAVGCALGMERLCALWELEKATVSRSTPDVYIMSTNAQVRAQALVLAEYVRETLPELQVSVHCGSYSMKNQFKQADKSGARLALILTDEPGVDNHVTVNYLREKVEQKTVSQEELLNLLGSLLL